MLMVLDKQAQQRSSAKWVKWHKDWGANPHVNLSVMPVQTPHLKQLAKTCKTCSQMPNRCTAPHMCNHSSQPSQRRPLKQAISKLPTSKSTRARLTYKAHSLDAGQSFRHTGNTRHSQLGEEHRKRWTSDTPANSRLIHMSHVAVPGTHVSPQLREPLKCALTQ